MVVGFNHNFSYKGELYHVQTEDSGVRNPQIITLLYRGGTILASQKTSYADIIKVDNLESVVEELMKNQHREMLRRLKNGELDHLLGRGIAAPAAPSDPVPTPVPPTPTVRPQPVSSSSAPPSPPPVATPVPTPVPTPAAPPAARATATPVTSEPAGLSLDEIILSYMVGEERKK